jgi:hypothetical protein
MKSCLTIIMLAGTLIGMESVLGQMNSSGGRSPGHSSGVQLVENLLGQYNVIGVRVDDERAASLIGGQTPGCGKWDVDTDGCEATWIYTVCPNNFNTYDGSEWFDDYSAHKRNSTRECSGGNAEIEREGSCIEGITDSLTGCVVTGGP